MPALHFENKTVLDTLPQPTAVTKCDMPFSP